MKRPVGWVYLTPFGAVKSTERFPMVLNNRKCAKLFWNALKLIEVREQSKVRRKGEEKEDCKSIETEKRENEGHKQTNWHV